MLYVGVDAHKAHSQMTVMDQTGTVLERRRAASSREGMLEALGRHQGEPMKAVLEAGYGWGPIYDWIGEVAEEVLLAHPLKVRAIADAKIKTDKLDSEMLAHLLRAELIPEAYAPSKSCGEMSRGSFEQPEQADAGHQAFPGNREETMTRGNLQRDSASARRLVDTPAPQHGVNESHQLSGREHEGAPMLVARRLFELLVVVGTELWTRGSHGVGSLDHIVAQRIGVAGLSERPLLSL